MEDVKHEQLLMLTFSRAAATEFKKRLLQLIGNAAHYVEVKTFHSYCFDLLGKVGNLNQTTNIIADAVRQIQREDVELSRITKSVLVIDEAQDMDATDFALVNALMEHNEDMRVIAVGDDDQNIYEFRGSNSKYLQAFITENNAVKYELIENYRSDQAIVDFANTFVQTIPHRLKNVPILAKHSGAGKVECHFYKSSYFIEPLVEKILSTGLRGSTCVLTRTNEEASQITGLLLKKGLPARLIQSNDGFQLHQLDELRFFNQALQMNEGAYTFSDDQWHDAKRALYQQYKNSRNFEVCKQMIQDFQTINTTYKYRSDWEAFIRESKMEDFLPEGRDTIMVSTIHKAKGKEFNQVFLMLSSYDGASQEAKRLLYVAITRAKTLLSIHTNTPHIFPSLPDTVQVFRDQAIYSTPSELAMHLGFKDIWLDYFISKQFAVSSLRSGDSLMINHDQCCLMNGHPVLKFSKSFMQKMARLNAQGYFLKEAYVNFILYWKKEDVPDEIKIILPELIFHKKTS